MGDGEAGIPLAAVVAQPGIEVAGRTAGLAGGEGWVAGVNDVEAATVEVFREKAYAHAPAEPAAPQRMVVGILQVELLVREKTYLVVDETSTHAMPATYEPQRQVGSESHGGGGVGVAQHLHGIDALDVYLAVEAAGGRVVECLQHPVVVEGSICLRTTGETRGKCHEDSYDADALF